MDGGRGLSPRKRLPAVKQQFDANSNIPFLGPPVSLPGLVSSIRRKLYFPPGYTHTYMMWYFLMWTDDYYWCIYIIESVKYSKSNACDIYIICDTFKNFLLKSSLGRYSNNQGTTYIRPLLSVICTCDVYMRKEYLYYLYVCFAKLTLFQRYALKLYLLIVKCLSRLCI